MQNWLETIITDAPLQAALPAPDAGALPWSPLCEDDVPWEGCAPSNALSKYLEPLENSVRYLGAAARKASCVAVPPHEPHRCTSPVFGCARAAWLLSCAVSLLWLEPRSNAEGRGCLLGPKPKPGVSTTSSYASRAAHWHFATSSEAVYPQPGIEEPADAHHPSSAAVQDIP